MFTDMLGLHPADQAESTNLERLEKELDDLFDEEDWINKGTQSLAGVFRGAVKGLVTKTKR